MRKLVAALGVAALAACGDNGETNRPIDAAGVDGTVTDAAAPDAATIDAIAVDATTPDALAIDATAIDATALDAAAPDAAVPIDATIDALPTDAPIDAPPPPPMSAVWFGGDWAADNLLKAGKFIDGATLPVTMPPTVVPGTQISADELPTSTPAFDVSAAGDRIIFLADSTTTGRYDLYIAAADGSSPQVVYTPQTGETIGAVALSPDGTKIAFLDEGATAGLDGAQDLYVVAAAASSLPVRVSERVVGGTTANNVFRIFTWSRDSRYVAFSGDLNVDGEDEVFVRDTVANTTATVLSATDIVVDAAATGARGIRGNPAFDAMNNVWFRARIGAGTTPPFQLFRAATDGSSRTAITSPTRADTTTAEIGAFTISPDGVAIAYSADAPLATAYEIYYAAVLMPTVAVRLTSGTIRAGGNAEFTNTPMMFSADGTRLAFVADFDVETEYEPYAATAGVANSARRLASITVANIDCDQVAWTLDSSAVYCRGDLAINNDTSLFRLDPNLTDQTPVLAVGVPTGGDHSDLKITRVP